MRIPMIVTVTAVAVSGVMMTTGAVSAEQDQHMCVSVRGDIKHQTGDATCESTESDGAPNVAMAKGADSFAIAGETTYDSGNRARAFGDASYAQAVAGDGNRATALGDASFAGAGNGDGNLAIASGEGSIAKAGGIEDPGDGNLAIASGDNSVAHALDGDGNTAVASGDVSVAPDEESYGAYATGGDGNLAIASGFDSYAYAGSGDGFTAIAAGSCRAEAAVDVPVTVICK
jgi:hypothetical protein